MGSRTAINTPCQTSAGFETSHLASCAGSFGEQHGDVPVPLDRLEQHLPGSELSHRCLGVKLRAGLGQTSVALALGGENRGNMQSNSSPYHPGFFG